MVGKLNEAIAAGEVYVAFQPIVNFERRDIFGYEALARSRSVDFKDAHAVIHEALESGCIGELGRELRAMAVHSGPRTALFLNLHPSEFNEGYGRLVDRRTVVVILSDGWDTGDPALLGRELESLRLRSRRLVWLNPLLGSPGYQPLTVGMQAALPHLSVFAPAHNLDALRKLGRYLQ